MKLLIGLLIMGTVLIGGGVGLRQSGIRMQTAEYQKTYGTWALSKGVTQEAMGLGLISFGGGLIVSGIIFTLLERRTKGV
jgi:hypothetical protein